MTQIAVSAASTAAFLTMLYMNTPDSRQTLLAPPLSTNAGYSSDFYPGAADVTLPHGKTHYYIFGPSDGPRVVLIHGFAVPSPVWKLVARRLASEGYQVLLYDLYGRGYSDAPPGRYDGALYVTQLSHLLQKIGWDRRPFNLAGVSMGGGIAMCFTHSFPELVQNLILCCPAGLMSVKDMPFIGRLISSSDSVAYLAQSPLLKPITKGAASSHSTRNTIGHKIDTPEMVAFLEDINKVANWQANHHPGFFRALTLSLAHFPLSGLEKQYESVGKDSSRPVLLIWGTSDHTIPFRYSEVVREKIPHAELVVIPDGSHDIVMTDHISVEESMLEFLRRVAK